MKKILYLLIALFLLSFQSKTLASDFDYDSLYEKAEVFKSKLYNDVDPFQDEDMIKYAWSPYPLFRTSAFLYFKDFVIEPGYYTLTPRTLSEKDYILFKQNGKVQFIIPAVITEQTPLNFYEANTPQMKLTKWQKISSGIRKKFYDSAKDSMRSSPPNSMVEVQVETKYIVLILFYGDKKYVSIFKRTPY